MPAPPTIAEELELIKRRLDRIEERLHLSELLEPEFKSTAMRSYKQAISELPPHALTKAGRHNIVQFFRLLEERDTSKAYTGLNRR